MNFTRTWLEYREGFGDVSSEFWLGNEALRLLTKDGSNWTIRVDLTDDAGQQMSLMTSPFSITGDKYALNVGSHGIEPKGKWNVLFKGLLPKGPNKTPARAIFFIYDNLH